MKFGMLVRKKTAIASYYHEPWELWEKKNGKPNLEIYDVQRIAYEPMEDFLTRRTKV